MTPLNKIGTYVLLIKNNPDSTMVEIANLAKELPIFEGKSYKQIKRELSSHASTNYHGIHRIDSEEGPKKLGVYSDEEQDNLIEEAIVEDEEDYNRKNIENLALSKMTLTEKYDYNEFWEISKKLNKLGLALDVDHAKSVKEFKEESINSNNLQLIMERANKKKNKSSMDRITWEQQLQIIEVAQITARADQDFVNRLMDQLKVIW